MPATYTLSTTTFVASVGKFDTQVKVASTSGLAAGARLFADRELMQVVSLGVSTLVNVRRGVDGTVAEPHGTDVTVYKGAADQFFSFDPQGRPREDLLVSPHINIRTGDVWFAQGDGTAAGQRWWQKQTIGHGVGPLGVRTTTPDVSSST
jgi:hypothetical protein